MESLLIMNDVTKLLSGVMSRLALQGDGPLREPSPASRVFYMQLSTTESEPTPLARDPTIQQLTILATVTSYVPFAPSPERNRSHSEPF